MLAGIGIGIATVLRAEVREHVVDLSNQPGVTRMNVSLRMNDIEISGHDNSSIILRGEGEDLPDPPPEGMRSLLGRGRDNTGAGLNLTIREDRVELSQALMHSSGPVEVALPASFALQVSNISGDIRIDGVRGEVSARTANGDIVVAGATSPLNLENADGNIQARFASYPDKPSSISSIDGDISVWLPKDAKATLELRTIDGDIVTDLPIEVTQVSSGPGRNIVRGTLNGGGAVLRVQTIDGDLLLRASE